MIYEDASDKYEDGVDEPDIVAVAEDNEDEDDGERQDTPPAEIEECLYFPVNQGFGISSTVGKLWCRRP